MIKKLLQSLNDTKISLNQTQFFHMNNTVHVLERQCKEVNNELINVCSLKPAAGAVEQKEKACFAIINLPINEENNNVLRKRPNL